MERHLLEVRGLSKSYGPNRVLSEIAFTLDQGESVAIIGENGAGKSTFAKILAGVVAPDQDMILLEGVPVRFHAPRDALRSGIAFIPQELAYVPELTVAENILLGQWPNRRGFTSQSRLRKRARAEAERFGIEVDVNRRMSSLKLADRQIVEILKALTRQARLILLDEPTAPLSDVESQNLFGLLAKLTDEGVGVVYISHRMDEVFRFSDRVDVFRNGALVASTPTTRTTPDELIAHMLGQAPAHFDYMGRSADAPRQPILSLVHWSSAGLSALSDVNMTLDRGEIVGLFGLRGSGAELIAEGLAGRHKDIKGTIVLEGTAMKVFPTPLAARRSNIGYVPAERKREGLVLSLAIQSNLTLVVLGLVSRLGILKTWTERALASQLVVRFDVRCRSLTQLVRQLSGGNQQKVLLASRLAARPHVLILQEPTRGVDVGARLEIHKLLREIASQGTAILLVTSDVEEAVTVSDRLLIMRDGAVVDELVGPSKTQGQALRSAARSVA